MTKPSLSSNSITLRTVKPEDSSLLLEIYRSTRADELALVSWWTDEQKNAFVQMQSDAQHAHYRHTFPHAEYLVVLFDDRPVGRLYLAELDSELRILDLTLLPRERNAGIGSYLLKQLIGRSSKEHKPLSINVESFNRSLKLFERLGFSRLSENGIYILMQHTAGKSDRASVSGD
jgi:ribosomal protein S18 acetylase RimI-like enzyme